MKRYQHLLLRVVEKLLDFVTRSEGYYHLEVTFCLDCDKRENYPSTTTTTNPASYQSLWN